MKNQVETERFDSELTSDVPVLANNEISFKRESIALAVLTVLLVACGSESSVDIQEDAGSAIANTDEGHGSSYCHKIDPRILEDQGAIDFKPGDCSVHDGDTINCGLLDGRFCGADAAECKACFDDGTGWPDQRGIGSYAGTNFCDAGRRYVDEAIFYANRFQVLVSRQDVYARDLIYPFVDGRLLPCELVERGLAWSNVEYYVQRHGYGAYPEYAQMIEKAGKHAPQPNFQEPWKWKPENTGPCQQ